MVKVSANEKEEYKIELSKNGRLSVVYADKKGNWLKEVDITE